MAIRKKLTQEQKAAQQQRSAKWNKENYKSYTMSLRRKEDKDIIDFIEEEKENGKSFAQVFREIFDVFQAWK